MERRSRLKPKPRTTKTGKTHTLIITARDVEIFRVLLRYRYLPVNFLHPLLPKHLRGNYKKFQERLTDLTGHGYLNRPEQQWDSYNAFYKKIVYELGKKGHDFMQEMGEDYGIKIGYGNSYHHEALTCLIIASMEIEAKDDFIHWPALLKFSKVPEETKESSTPFNIPLVGMEQKTLLPDGTPFCIKGKRTICFPGTETDMGTESLTGTKRDTIKKKLQAYINVARNKTYKKHYGFPNMVVPFITTSETRMKNMMKLLERLTDGKGCSFIIFKHTPHLRSVSHSPDPVSLLSEEWERVGHPPFDLSKELNK